jgi:hypothetical protein
VEPQQGAFRGDAVDADLQHRDAAERAGREDHIAGQRPGGEHAGEDLALVQVVGADVERAVAEEGV